MPNQWTSLVIAKANEKKIDPNMTTAIQATENASGNPNAINYEYGKGVDPNSALGAQYRDPNNALYNPSIGVFQIRTTTAQQIAHDAHWHDLDGLSRQQVAAAMSDPKKNVEYGTEYIKQQQAKGYKGDDLISAYNGGHPLHSASGGGYVNQQYVNWVRAKMGEGPGGPVNPNQANADRFGAVSINSIPAQSCPVPKDFSDVRAVKPPFIPANPDHATIELSIGGVTFTPVLTGTAVDLKLREFQYQEKMGSGGSRFMIRLFIPTAEVVNKLTKLAANNNQVKFRWGYTSAPGGMSDVVEGFILQFNPEFLESGFDIVMEGMDYSYTAMGAAGPTSYAPVTGMASDIVCWIATKNNWKAIIEPTQPIIIDGKPKIWQRPNKSELAFIIEDLVPGAQSSMRKYGNSPDGLGAYRAFFEGQTLHFHSIYPSKGAKPVRHYVWGGEGKNVLYFKPQFNPRVFLMLGAGKTTYKAIDPITNELIVSTLESGGIQDGANPQQTQQDQLGYTLNQDLTLSGIDAYRIRTSPEGTDKEVESRLSQQFFELRQLAFTATLETIGDPQFRAGDLLDVQVQRPGTPPIQFYNWLTLDVTHTIRDGRFTCDANLLRDPSQAVLDDNLKPCHTQRFSMSDVSKGQGGNEVSPKTTDLQNYKFDSPSGSKNKDA